MSLIEKPLCIIPAKGTSKRFKKKNIATLSGKPLLSYSIESAINSKIFDKICVSTEDEKILKVSKKYDVLSLKRPEELSEDDVQVKDVCKYLLEYFQKKDIKYSSFCVLLPTSPLRSKNDIIESYKIFKENDAECVMSVVKYSYPPQRALCVKNNFLEPFLGNEYMKQTQKLEKLYRHDGSVIFCKTKKFLENKGFYKNKIIPYFIDKNRAVDIDNPVDLEWAEFLLSKEK